jgi:single-stranded-DNA-specific exonuclease
MRLAPILQMDTMNKNTMIVSPAGDETTTPIVLEQRMPLASSALTLESQGLHPLLASLFSARGVEDIAEVRGTIDHILAPSTMKNCLEMASFLADCVLLKKRVLVISDYDCDGATACATLMVAFRAAGMQCDYLVPDRKIHGYGLTAPIVLDASNLVVRPDVIVTVDAGITSNEGVELANQLGIEVLITDHHMAPLVLPNARLIVNPNQPGCTFASKNIAGCGVAWYVAAALADELNDRGVAPGYDPIQLLPFVAIGTVADVVPLDQNNRILISEGLKQIRLGECTHGIKALICTAQKPYARLTCNDIGFYLGPRINAAGRLAHMSAGVECLLSMDTAAAIELAESLDQINIQRKLIQKGIVQDVDATIQDYLALAQGSRTPQALSMVLYDPEWHEGVIGIVASRIKEEMHRPTFVMCTASNGNIKGSGRSIDGFHLKHALDQIVVQYPGIILTHGGHPMAAGLTIYPDKLEQFKLALEEICQQQLTLKQLQRSVAHDGGLPERYMNLETIRLLSLEVWGNKFPEPQFIDSVDVGGYRLIGDKRQHLKLRVSKGDVHVDLLAFGEAARANQLPEQITVVYKAQINAYRGTDSLQMLVQHIPAAGLVASYRASQDAAAADRITEIPVEDTLGMPPSRRPGFRRL